MKFDFWVFAKGVLMGAADIVPGVSGGTIAFITGIYEKLVFSIRSILPQLMVLLKERNIVRFWDAVNGGFLVTLLSGILTSVVLFAKIITFLLFNYPIPLWAFFFGLIIASVFIVARGVAQWRGRTIALLVLGGFGAWLITGAAPSQLQPTYLNAFGSGVIAICAMILPGISGSFVLVILGTYTFILGALKQFDLVVISIFTLGCLVGLLSIANVLSWAFSKYHSETLAILTGVMIGALNKVWPWKEVISYREDSHGRLVPLIESNVLPGQYELLTGVSSQLYVALMCGVLAFGLVVLLERLADTNEK